MEAQKLITSINGMNNRVSPDRLIVDPNTGTGHVAEISGMRINENGDCSLDIGNSIVLTDDYHSIFCDKSFCFVGNGHTIEQFLPDNTSKLLVSDLSGKRFSYCRLGDITFYSDTVANIGILSNGTTASWTKQQYLEDSERVFSGPMVFRHMQILNGRAYLVPADEPDTIVWSERGQLGLFNRAESFRRFESDILMIAAVESGLFISTKNRIVFVRITSPHTLKLEGVVIYPAVEWSLAHRSKDGIDIGLDIPGECRFWRSAEGHCIGAPNGKMYNITEQSILMPENCSNSGASIIVGNYFYSAGN